ncbi:MAG: hypothetical protein ACFE8E_14190 [Candidatus Hodarchaeota archaeon]
MKSGRALALISGLITIVGTYVLTVSAALPNVSSGIGFITNLTDLFADPVGNAAYIGVDVWVYYILVVLFIVFLAADVLQIIGMANRAVSFIFSLFPLAIGLMFFFLTYTDVLGIKSEFFETYFEAAQIGGIFPFHVPLGDLGLGTYVLIAGGALGIISVFMKRKD